LLNTSVATDLKARPVVPGSCSGEVLVLNRYLSFFGEVDPETGCLRENELICISGKILVFKGSRGSTVGPYVMYALKKSNKAPSCIIVEEVEPLLVAGCVLADIPLFTMSRDDISRLQPGLVIELKECGGLYCVEYRV